MVIGPEISEMHPGDAAEVEALLLAAFPGPDEAKLVRDLRAAGAMVSERVIRWQGRIGAYAGISRMIAPKGWHALAPVAVLPEWQGGALGRDQAGAGNDYRLGTRVVQEAAGMYIEHSHAIGAGPAPEDGTPTLVVLGKPSFYARCGFSSARAARLASRYPVEYLLIARAGNDIPEATLIYPAVFDGV
jgi:putative acetyltransferase